jgi:hypothetical protein
VHTQTSFSLFAFGCSSKKVTFIRASYFTYVLLFLLWVEIMVDHSTQTSFLYFIRDVIFWTALANSGGPRDFLYSLGRHCSLKTCFDPCPCYVSSPSYPGGNFFAGLTVHSVHYSSMSPGRWPGWPGLGSAAAREYIVVSAGMKGLRHKRNTLIAIQMREI